MPIPPLSRFSSAICCLFLLLTSANTALGTPVSIGLLTFSEFIPGAPGLPGINSFDIASLSGPFALPPDFPVASDLTLRSARLELFQGSTLWAAFDLGDLGPGFALDPFSNPVVQVPSDQAFTSAVLTATLAPVEFEVDGGSRWRVADPAIRVELLPNGGGGDLAAGFDSALITVQADRLPDVAPVPEPALHAMLAIGMAILLAVKAWRRPAAAALLVTMGSLQAQNPAPVALTATTSPAAGQPGVTTMSITGSGFPAAAFAPNQVTITLTAVGTGPAMTASASAVATVAGSSRRISFSFAGSNVGAPAQYRVGVSGPGFASSNTALMTVNPPAAISLNPASSLRGRSLAVAIAGQFTSFLTGSTRANFGPGISVGGAAAGTFGPLTVTNPGSATAQLTIAADAGLGTRTISVATGVQQASAPFALTDQTPSNSPPAITSLPITTGTLLQPYAYNVVANDVNGDALTYSLAAAPLGMAIGASTGAITWTPPGTGTLSVAVQVSDGRGGVASQAFVVAVAAPPNGPPILSAIGNRTVNVGDSIGIRLTATDPNYADALQYSLTSGPSGAGLAPSPMLRWTAGAPHIGAQPFSVRVQDPAGLTDAKSFTVTVLNGNVAPVFVPQPDDSVQAGGMFSRLLAASDPNPGDTVRFLLLSGPAGLTVEQNGQLAWNPSASQYGINKVKVQVTDSGGLFDATTFKIDVGASLPNYPPVANADRYAVRRGTTLTVPARGVLSNDTDEVPAALTARLIAPPAKGALSLAANGSFGYTPAPPLPNSTEPKLKFGFAGAAGLVAVSGSPVVVDLDKDGVAEIVFVAFGSFGLRRLYAVNGATGATKFVVDGFVPAENVQISLASSIAAGDLDGDGFPEILVVSDETIPGTTSSGPRRRIIAYNGDGTRRWISPDLQDGVRVLETTGAKRLMIANVTGDSKPEIIFGHQGKTNDLPVGAFAEELVTILNHLGQPLGTTRTSRGGNSENLVVADIDLDGAPDILHHTAAISGQGLLRWSISSASVPSVKDIAVANLDDDPFAEIVYLDYNNQMHCFEHTGVRKWGFITVPVGGGTLDGTGPIAIGDADGNGTSEILIARGNSLHVFGGNGALQRSIPLPFDNRGGIPAIFDLNGDGKPEIIHQTVRGPFDTASTIGALVILDGPTGALLHTIKASRTADFPGSDVSPVIADVDGDGAAEIVVGQWSEPATEMIRVFEANTGHWMPARPVANQLAYSVTNVNADGTIPASPAINWLTPGLNNYRVYSAPPAERTSDLDQFTYVANDGVYDSNAATVRIDILPPNTAPRIVSTAPKAATPSVEYLYGVRAVDPDPGDTLQYALAKGVAGMTIDLNNGLIRWIPAPAQLGSYVLAVKVTDSLGQSGYEGFTLTVGPPAVVPNVVSQTEAAARTTLAGAGLIVGSLTQSPSATMAAGRVVSHEPASGAGVAAGSPVNLVLSSGPAAVPVPAVAGKPEGAAQTLLSEAGFAAVVTRVFSNTVPLGTVINQSPSPGVLLVPGSVAMTISSGSGLHLSLARAVTTADVPIAFTASAYDLNGVESAAPPLQFAVAASPAPFLGGLPAVAGSSIVPAADTRGAFRVTATDAVTGRSVFADFAVTIPRVAGARSMMDEYADLTAAMADIDSLIRQGRLALIQNDTPRMRLLMQQMVTRWRAFDRSKLQFAVPLALETGFPPLPSQLALYGLTLTPDDKLMQTVLKDAAADLQAMIDAHRSTSATVAQLRDLYDRFGTRAARLDGLNLSEAGTIQAQAVLTVLASHRLPDLYNALMDDIGRTVGIAPIAPRSFKGRISPQSTLAELTVTTALQFLVDKAMDALSAPIRNAKQFTGDILKQGAYAAAAVIAARHIRAAPNRRPLDAVISGASLSFRVFEAGFTMIEGDVDPEYPELNQVILVGPDIVAPVREKVDKIVEKVSESAGESFKLVSTLAGVILDIAVTSKALEYAVNNALAGGSKAAAAGVVGFKGCIFSNAPECNELVFPEGFKPVYTYSPPPGFLSLSGLPVPIITVVQNRVSGAISVDTPVFLPAKE